MIPPARAGDRAALRPGSGPGMQISGQRFVSANHLAEQFGKGDRCVVFVERAEDLHAHGQPARCAADGCGYSRQARQRGVRYPERLAVIRPLALGGRDAALVEGPGVVRERRGEVRRAQEHVDLAEVALPGGTSRHAPVLVLDDLRQCRGLGAGLLEGEEQLHVEPERLGRLRRVQPVGPALGNRRAGPGERVYRVGHQRGDFAGDRGLAVVEHHAHAEIPQPGVTRRRQGPGVSLRPRALGAGGDAQRGPQVACGPAERAHRAHVHHVTRPGWRTRRLEPGQRDGAGARLQPVDAAEAGRDADGPDEVGSVFEEGHPGGQRRGRSAGGAARRARGVPRVAGDPVQLVGGLGEVGQHEGHVGLPGDDRAGPLKPPHHRGVPVGDEILERGIAPGGVQPGHVEAVLDRHGHAVQQSHVIAAGDRLVGRGRLPQGRLAADLDHGVQLWVDRIDPGEQHLGQLARRCLPAAEHSCRIDCRLQQRCVHERGPLVRSWQSALEVRSPTRPGRRRIRYTARGYSPQNGIRWPRSSGPLPGSRA